MRKIVCVHPLLELIESVSSILQQVIELQLSCYNRIRIKLMHAENICSILCTLHRSVHEEMSSRLGLMETGNSGWIVTFERPQRCTYIKPCPVIWRHRAFSCVSENSNLSLLLIRSSGWSIWSSWCIRPPGSGCV